MAWSLAVFPCSHEEYSSATVDVASTSLSTALNRLNGYATYIHTGTHKFWSLLYFKTIYSHMYFPYSISPYAFSMQCYSIFLEKKKFSSFIWGAVCQARFSCPKHQALTWSITCPPLPLPHDPFPKLLQLSKWTEPHCLSSFPSLLSPLLYL